MRFNPHSGMAKALALFAIPVLAVLLALPGTTYAQRMTGELSGSVVDESGGVIPGADVTVINEASGAVRRSVTNSDGFFAFSALPAATYTVKISIPGFNSYEVKGIELRSGDSRSLRQIQLKVATVAETVSVNAEVALTPLNSGEKSATLTSEQIEDIPIMGTSAAEVLRLLPGMTPMHRRHQQQAELHRRGVRHQRQRRPGRGNSRAPSATTPPTATAPGPSTSRSTAPPAPTPAATARPPSTRTPSSSRSSRSCRRTSPPSTRRARWP